MYACLYLLLKSYSSKYFFVFFLYSPASWKERINLFSSLICFLSFLRLRCLNSASNILIKLLLPVSLVTLLWNSIKTIVFRLLNAVVQHFPGLSSPYCLPFSLLHVFIYLSNIQLTYFEHQILPSSCSLPVYQWEHALSCLPVETR